MTSHLLLFIIINNIRSPPTNGWCNGDCTHLFYTVSSNSFAGILAQTIFIWPGDGAKSKFRGSPI